MGLSVERFDLQRKDISGSKMQEVKAEELSLDNVSLAKTVITNANMSRMSLTDINMSKCKISDANLSHAVIDHVLLFGTEFRNVVLTQEGDGNYSAEGKYKPIAFDHCDLSNSQYRNCNLANVELTDCNISGLKINGILIEELISRR